MADNNRPQDTQEDAAQEQIRRNVENNGNAGAGTTNQAPDASQTPKDTTGGEKVNA